MRGTHPSTALLARRTLFAMRVSSYFHKLRVCASIATKEFFHRELALNDTLALSLSLYV